jgi:hypothetical protein
MDERLGWVECNEVFRRFISTPRKAKGAQQAIDHDLFFVSPAIFGWDKRGDLHATNSDDDSRAPQARHEGRTDHAPSEYAVSNRPCCK